MQENITSLDQMYSAAESLPAVATFHGTSGLMSIWKDILGGSGEILLWTNQSTESRLFESAQHQQFVQQRTKKNLPIRVLTVDNREGRGLAPHDNLLLRQTRFLPPETSFSAETYLYDGKISILDYQNGIFGLVITSRLIYEAQKAIFEMAWELSWRQIEA